MKPLSVLFLLFISTLSIAAQGIQDNAPWMVNSTASKASKKTLKEITDAAEAYFKTIDRNKKGSGLKPYERWKYRAEFFVKPDGTLSSSKDLWDAWEMKSAMSSVYRNTTTMSAWTSIGPYNLTNTASSSPGTGRVNVVAVDPSNPNTYYIGTPAGGIWKSTDAGINWSPLSDYLPQIGVSGIAIHPTNPDIIYIATGDDVLGDARAIGVWKSTNGGNTWNNTGTLDGNPNSMNEIYIHPDDHETLLVATNIGIYKTTNGGNSWTRVLTANINDLKMKPGDPTIWYAASRTTFYRSTDSGETFTPVNIAGFSNSGKIVMDVTPADPNLVFFVSATPSSAFNGIYKSTNSGQTFEKTEETNDIFQSPLAWYALAFTISDTDPNILYVGVLDIWKSVDGGDHFSKMNNWHSPHLPTYTHADIQFLRFFDGKFFAGTDGGVYMSTDLGAEFTDLTKKIAIGQFYNIAIAVQNPENIVGGLQDNGGYAYSQDNWNIYFGGDGTYSSVNAQDPNNYFGLTQNGGSLYETKDGGLTRTEALGAPTAETGVDDRGGRWVTPMVSNSQGDIYAGYSKLYKLENNDWAEVSDETFGGDLHFIEVDPNNDDNMYVSRGISLYKSNDRGLSFSSITFSHGTINCIEVSNTDSNTAWIVTNGGVFKTTNLLDDTPTFIDISGNLPGEPKLVLKHHERSGNNTVYLGTALGVYTINDDISSWEPFDNGLPNVMISDLEINEEDAKLIASTYGRGLFETFIPEQLPTTDVRLLSINKPTNQVNCSTTIFPNITVKNRGINNITAITINYSVDGGTTNVLNWTGNLSSGQTTEISIPNVIVALGSHSLDIDINTSGDAYATNNNASVNFLANYTNTNPTEVNTFEDVNDDALISLTTGDTTNSVWEIARPGKTLLNSSGSGSKTYITKSVGTYPNNTVSYLYTNCYDLTTITGPVISFKMGFDLESNRDYMVMEYSIDSGVSWTILGDFSNSSWYNSSVTLFGLPGKQWSGEGENTSQFGNTNADLNDYSYDLSAFSNEPNIVFRFKLVTNEQVSEEGVMIDDLVINGTLSVSNPELLKSLTIYPNPSNDIFNVKWNNNEKAIIAVYNYLGKLILKEKSTEANKHYIKMKGYAKGLYLVKVITNNKQAIKKVVLE